MIMRQLIIFIFTVFSYTLSYSQIHEIGVFAGGSNFIGDVGATNYISPNQPTFGLLYKWNRSPRHSFRFSVIYADIEGIDTKSDDPRRKARGYSFTNNLIELSAGMEFTFLDFNLHDGTPKTTPYLYTGVTVANFDNYYFNNAGERISEDTTSNAYGIPMVVGIKSTLTERLILGLEIGARYTFTDEIDGSISDAKSKQIYKFGNTNNNDWYVFTGATLTFTFGRKPCYCDY